MSEKGFFFAETVPRERGTYIYFLMNAAVALFDVISFADFRRLYNDISRKYDDERREPLSFKEIRTVKEQLKAKIYLDIQIEFYEYKSKSYIFDKNRYCDKDDLLLEADLLKNIQAYGLDSLSEYTEKLLLTKADARIAQAAAKDADVAAQSDADEDAETEDNDDDIKQDNDKLINQAMQHLEEHRNIFDEELDFKLFKQESFLDSVYDYVDCSIRLLLLMMGLVYKNLFTKENLQQSLQRLGLYDGVNAEMFKSDTRTAMLAVYAELSYWTGDTDKLNLFELISKSDQIEKKSEKQKKAINLIFKLYEIAFAWFRVDAVRTGVGLKCHNLITAKDFFLCNRNLSYKTNLKGKVVFATISSYVNQVQRALGDVYVVQDENPTALLEKLLAENHIERPSTPTSKLTVNSYRRLFYASMRCRIGSLLSEYETLDDSYDDFDFTEDNIYEHLEFLFEQEDEKT